jgi:hypothetical protein
MHFLTLYFQYTHLSNTDLRQLRTLLIQWEAKVHLVSAKQITNLNKSVIFGKLLTIRVPIKIYTSLILSTLLSTFPVLKLVYISYNGFNLSPSLYNTYIKHSLINVPFSKLYSLSVQLNNTRLSLYNVKYLILSLNILFQETYLYKTNIQYIC